jgi:diacylglycerol kinase (ATP)
VSPGALDRAVLLVNPAARAAARRGWLDAARAELGPHLQLDVQVPADVRTMATAARDASAQGITVIVAGGDGTVNLVAGAIAPHRGTMGILPLGTANDLARELGIPRAIREAARTIARGTPHPTDLVSVNDRRFVTVGGLGVVAATTVGAARLRAGPFAALANAAGAGIYKLAASAALLGHASGIVRVTWRDLDARAERTMELDVHGVFITNHATCGGGLVIPTGSIGDDGILEIALVPRSSRARLLGNFTRLSLGRPLGNGAIVVLRTDRAILETGNDESFVADGELLATGRRFVLAAEPRTIAILR